MGGAQAGEIASRMAIEAFERGLSDGAGASGEELLADLVQEANERIHELSHERESRAGMGTTMTAALVGEHEVTIAHVGDSRAYRLRDEELERLTERPLARRGAAPPGPAHRRGGRRAPAALDHHARARARGPTSTSTRAPGAAWRATSFCCAATG